MPFCNHGTKTDFLAAILLSSLAFEDFLSHSRFLAFSWNKSKLLCTIETLSDLFRSVLEGPHAIYR